MILHLKSFNQHVEYQHFKMDSFWKAIYYRLITPKLLHGVSWFKGRLLLGRDWHLIELQSNFNFQVSLV